MVADTDTSPAGSLARLDSLRLRGSALSPSTPGRRASGRSRSTSRGRSSTSPTGSSPSTSPGRAGSSTTRPRSGTPCGPPWPTSPGGSSQPAPRWRPSGSRTSGRRRWPGTARTGRPLAPAIVWQDRRTADHCDRARRRRAPPARPGPNRTGARSVLLGDEVRVAAHRRRHYQPRRRPRRCRPGARHGRLVGVVEPDRWAARRGVRHRRDERRRGRCSTTSDGASGRTSCARCSTSRAGRWPTSGRRAVGWARSIRTRSAGRRPTWPGSSAACRSAASPATSRPRCSAKPASTRAWRR